MSNRHRLFDRLVHIPLYTQLDHQLAGIMLFYFIYMFLSLASDESDTNPSLLHVQNFFDELNLLAQKKQKEAGVKEESGIQGPISGLQWVTRSTPITANEIIEHLLSPLHHEVSFMIYFVIFRCRILYCMMKENGITNTRYPFWMR